MNSSIYVIMVVYVFNCHCEWALKWHDEFDGNELDKTKWTVTDGKDILEAPVNEEVLSYSRDSNKNLHFIDGVLAITPVQEINHDRTFTTATINSKMAFLYGRLDIRVALPKGKMLKSVIILEPEKNDYGRERVNGEIEIVADIQRDHYFSRVSHHGKFGAMKTYKSLNDFEEYSLEWNEKMITWSTNGSIRRTFDLDRIIDSFYQEKGQPFDRNFYISMRFQVFKFQTDEFVPGEKFHENWKCPSLLIDYVRLYQQVNSTDLNSNNTQNIENSLKSSNKTKENICHSINNKLRLIYHQGYFSLKLFLFVGVPFCTLIIIISLVVLTYLLVRKKKRLPEENVYADYMDYDDPGNMGNYEYCDVVYTRKQNNYVTDQDQNDLKNQGNYIEFVEIR